MEELFGVPMRTYMGVLLAILVPTGVAIGFLAWRNPVFLKLGLRNIPRRRAQTILIIVGIMLSTIIISASFGTGDTISYSIRNEAIESLGTIDEIMTSTRASTDDSFGSSPYILEERFLQLQRDVSGIEGIDGLAPGIGEVVPALNPRTSLSEGKLRIAGVAPEYMDGFGTFKLTTGEEALLSDLSENEVYINERAVEELDAVDNDSILVFVAGQELVFKVKGQVSRGGLAGDSSTIIMPLERAQRVFNKPAQINNIVVSNRGDEFSGADLSEEVTRQLRVLVADRAVASQLKELLNKDAVLAEIRWRLDFTRGTLRSDISRTVTEIQRGTLSNQLVSLLADDRVSKQVLIALDNGSLEQTEKEAITLFAELGEFTVLDIKRQLLERADDEGSQVTTFFIIMGLFSITVGMLLIFLIFVMLAAARRSEMGMARAIGAKRRHLVQMFLFEGTAYALVSSAVGVLLGLAVSVVIVELANRIFADGGGGVTEGFQLTRHFEVHSMIVAYCLGMVITLGTVGVSAYRVSRLNIVAAVRGLPPPVNVAGKALRELVLAPGYVLLRPVRLAAQEGAGSFVVHPVKFLNYVFQILWAVVFSFPIAVVGTTFQVFWRAFKRGWLALLLGLAITWSGMAFDEAFLFRIGVSLVILGAGLILRTVLQTTSVRAEVLDRIVATSIGVVMLAFWVVPFEILRRVAGDLNAGPEMFFVSGISMVASAVWTVMYNSDLLLKVLTTLGGRSGGGRTGKFRAVLVTAVAYPMSSKFRTGLTLAMFALVMFTLIVMSILNTVFDVSMVDQETVTGGWAIESNVNLSSPILDIRQAIEDAPRLESEDFAAIGGYTTIHIEARQIGAEDQKWRDYAVRAADDEYLASTNHKFKLIADVYGPTDEDVWEAMREDPSLAVVETWVVPTRSRFNDSNVPFRLSGVYYEDDSMPPIPVEVRDPRSGALVQLTVIGVLHPLSDSFSEIALGMFTSRSLFDDALPSPIPITTYRFQLTPGVNAARTAKALEASFQHHGLEAEGLEALVEERASAQRAFFHLFTGFMGMGLLVGIAALGVVSLRAVVERRQQIGVLRAIGYRRWMVQLSFLMESSFVVLLGTGIGVALGTVISYNIVNDVRENDGIESLRFVFPWVQIAVIVAIAYVFSLVATFLPARQASQIYPAEALRYE